jgi:hypothetical protein
MAHGRWQKILHDGTANPFNHRDSHSFQFSSAAVWPGGGSKKGVLIPTKQAEIQEDSGRFKGFALTTLEWPDTGNATNTINVYNRGGCSCHKFLQKDPSE